MSIIKQVQVGDLNIKLEFQKFAKQANASVMVTCDDTQILVTVCAADNPTKGQDFFPLTVDYFEKFYAAGKIPGGFFKREAKPSDRETLMARVIDRSLRPCFPKEYLCETFITVTVVSYDSRHHPAPLAILGASCALMISDIPFNGPVGALYIGADENTNFIIDPGELNLTKLDLIVAARPGGILMVEAGSNFLTEEQIINAIEFAQASMSSLFSIQLELQKEIGCNKRQIPVKQVDSQIKNFIDSKKNQIIDIFNIKEKKQRNKSFSTLLQSIILELNPDEDIEKSVEIKEYFEHIKSDYMRSLIINEQKRIDGRVLEEIRPINCEIGVLKRPHGSALFTRGETQALASITLGAAEDEQRLDNLVTPEATKRFILHYNFPPFSVGEARPHRSTGRREIGHGALAERALKNVIPSEEEFGYTIRLVSEILESNGSSSMATVCAGTLALLHAGVPIKTPIAGVAMGLIKDNEKFFILTDILGDEDHLGDMDFKVCGSLNGITALQMDIKVDGISKEILIKALDQAKKAREFILQKITSTIDKPAKLSDYAPKIFNLKIKPDKIKDLIGPNGKHIKKIIANTGVKINIEEDGCVVIVANDNSAAEEAKKLIRQYTTDPEIGEIFLGTIKKVLDFGVIVELKPGVEGLCHISQLENKRIQNIFDTYSEGMEILVKVIDIDNNGRLKLSRKDAMGSKPL